MDFLKAYMALTCVLVGATTLFAPPPAFAQKGERKLKYPVIMEEATVRGRVIMLETRKEDRKAVSEQKLEVWTQETEEKKPEKVYETKTDERGFFNLPILAQGNYRIILGELEINLQVIPKAPVREGQEEPKIVLILLPREVFD